MPTLSFWHLHSPGGIEVRDWVSESVRIIFKSQKPKDLQYYYYLRGRGHLHLLL